MMMVEQMDKWAKSRAKGKQRYILVKCGLLGGLVATLAFEILKPIEKGFEFSWYFSSSFLREFITAFMVFMMVGIIAGGYQWSHMERKYNKRILEKNKPKTVKKVRGK
jgi:hypothetical protein